MIFIIFGISKVLYALRASYLEACLALHLFKGKSFGYLSQYELSSSVLEHSQLSDHHRDHSFCSQGKSALGQELDLDLSFFS